MEMICYEEREVEYWISNPPGVVRRGCYCCILLDGIEEQARREADSHYGGGLHHHHHQTLPSQEVASLVPFSNVYVLGFVVSSHRHKQNHKIRLTTMREREREKHGVDNK
jgi:hypothetical protein